MNKQIRELCLQFLDRVDLKGYEVPAFNKVINALFEDNKNNEVDENTEDEPIKEPVKKNNLKDNIELELPEDDDYDELEEQEDEKKLEKKKRSVDDLIKEVERL